VSRLTHLPDDRSQRWQLPQSTSAVQPPLLDEPPPAALRFPLSAVQTAASFKTTFSSPESSSFKNAPADVYVFEDHSASSGSVPCDV
jgi:hypothetical protein